MKKISLLLFLALALCVGVGYAQDTYVGQVHDGDREYAAYLRTESIHGTRVIRKGDPIVVVTYYYQVVLAPTDATLKSLRDQLSDNTIAYKAANYRLVAYSYILDHASKPELHLYLVSRALMAKDGKCLYKESDIDDVPITVSPDMDPTESRALSQTLDYIQAHKEVVKESVK